MRPHTQLLGVALTSMATLLTACSATDTTSTATTATTPSPTATVTASRPPSPEPSRTLSPTTSAIQTPAPSASSSNPWDRYGPLLDTSFYTDEYLSAFAPSVCADVGAGKIESGFLHGFITGGNLPEYVRPQATFVWAAARAVELGCPDLTDDLATLLDAYDEEHEPY